MAGRAVTEPDRRHWSGPVVAALAAVSALAAIVWSSSLPLWVGWRLYSEQVLIVVLAASMAIVFLTVPFKRRETTARPAPGRIDILLAAAALGFGLYLTIRFPVLAENVFYHPREALTVSLIGLALLLESIRRSLGWSLIVILGIVCLYALFSGELQGPLQSRSIRWDRLVTFLILDSAALAGSALYIAVAVVVPFLILAQLLLMTGGSAFFADLSIALTGRARGGSAKIAILGSALFGSVSGSAVSNVASTGAITIPLMKEGGYRPKTAAALEASASTGGQLMPPIMGASAFLLAENLQVAYSEVVLAALVPSMLFYLSLFLFADFEAGRRGIAPVPTDRIPRLGEVMRRGWFLLVPFAVLLGSLFILGRRPETSALYAVLALFILSFFKTYEGNRINLSALATVLIRSGRAAVEVVLICAIAGLIIGLFARSGLSFGMGFFLVQLGKSSLILLLMVTAVVCILLGMGLPTVGVYLLLATLAAPPLIELGLAPMPAHLFVLYFGMMSMLTPPVAIAAFVAANMAKAPPMQSGFEAVRIAWPAFVVPFLFVASPGLLLAGPPGEIIVTVLATVAGVYLITAGLTGFVATSAGFGMRALLVISGILLIVPLPETVPELVRLVGLAGGAAALFLQYGKARRFAQETA